VNDTGIAWADFTWNPVSGCKKVSAGCKFCYAETSAESKRGTPAFPNGFDLTLRPHKLDEPYSLRGSKRIFVNSMSDMFWEEIPDDYLDTMLRVIENTPQHQYQILTKRPDEMLRHSRRRPLPSNVWAGVTIENQQTADRLDILKQVDVPIRFVSAEPLLGPLALDLTGIHWLIGGGESGDQISSTEVGRRRALVERVNGRWVPKAEGLAWMRSLRDQCLSAGIAFFFKQWGGPTSRSGGCVLDGRTWHDFPSAAVMPAAERHGA